MSSQVVMAAKVTATGAIVAVWEPVMGDVKGGRGLRQAHRLFGREVVLIRS